MFVSRLAASGLLLLALLAVSLDGKPVQQWSQNWPAPKVPPLVVQRWPHDHHIPPLVVQDWKSPTQLQPRESPAGGTTALREELSLGPEAALDTLPAGPDVGPRGLKAVTAPQRLSKSKAVSRPMRDLRTDGKQARQNWGRMLNPDHHSAAGGGGGGGGGARPLQGLAKKRAGNGCFGLKLDRIGSLSGLGC
uniref:Bradykinin potentiating and C-type natriuretic peptides 1b n=1 Tax=Crotalus horridus TaxID=35024 RepID=A0A0K8RSC2_CROHD